MIRGLTARRLRVALLAGGDSPEREVSLAGGRNVARALDALGHRVTCFDPIDSGVEQPRPANAGFRPIKLDQADWSAHDVCFLVLHGGAGEDGRVQQLLASRGVPFTGPGPCAAQLAMCKLESKRVFAAAAVPTPTSTAFTRSDEDASIVAAADRLGYPLVVKPASQGSSLGVSLARNPRELPDCIARALSIDTHGLLEQFIAGREFTLTVLDGEPLPLAEIACGAPIFSFADKYSPATQRASFDFALPREQRQALLEAGLAAARALDATGLVRVDLRLDSAGQPWVLELNAIPGMTPTSLAPAAAHRAGLELPELCARMLQGALDRHGRQDTDISDQPRSKDRSHVRQEKCHAA